MEASPELEQAADPPPAAQRADRRARHAREDLQQRALAGTVAADHADDVAALHFEFDSAEGPELRGRGARGGTYAPPQELRGAVGQPVAGRVVPDRLTEPV